MADKLTPAQAQAVYDRGGRLLVSAAAGSGKTKVLVDRLMTCLTDEARPANLDEFLIITYTRAAASELRAKIAAKLTERIAAEPGNRHLQKQLQRLYLAKISTVHGFCADILKEYAYRLDLPADFRVAEELECAQLQQQILKDLLDQAYEELGEDSDFCALVDTQGLGRSDDQLPELIVKVYNSARCHRDPEKWLDECLASSAAEDVRDVSDTLWGKYLMQDLFDLLDRQIGVLECCIQKARDAEGLEKAAANLSETLEQLKALRKCERWDEIVRRKNLAYSTLTFPRKKADPLLCEQIKAARNACKEKMAKALLTFSDDSAQILRALGQSAAAQRGLIALVRRFDRAYSRAKRSRRLLDFGDLEHQTLDLLLGPSRSAPTAAAVEIGKRFREIMVDEYQDSNDVQDAIFTSLTEQRKNCFLVGDVKQSIYQFRLADPGIFLAKYHAYVPAGQAQPGQGRKVLLSHNFRSGPEIIEAVNHVFSCCMRQAVGGIDYGEDEALREGVPHSPLPEPGTELYALETAEDTTREEAAFVAARIQTMLREQTLVRDGDGLRPVRPSDIVILLRSPGPVGGEYQKALEPLGIRCASGAGVDMLRTPEISTLRAILQTVANPRQDIPLISALASPVFGFTADDLACIRSAKKRGPVFDALLENDLPKTRAFLDLLKQLRAAAKMQTLTELLEQIFLLTRLDSIYAAQPGGDGAQENLRQFFQLAAEYEKGNLCSLDQFLQYLDGLEEKGLMTSSAAGTDAVTLMSIHKSKGLEFPVVFLCGLSRKFNQESQRDQILCDRELGLGLRIADNTSRVRYPSVCRRAIAAKMTAESISEEMRVLYVAMTRARDRLIMTYAAKKLENALSDIALRLPMGGGELLCREAVCPGDWILLAALQRTEAGELQVKAGAPVETQVSGLPWKICVVQPEPGEIGELHPARKVEPTPEHEEALRECLCFSYPHSGAVTAPSKQTATGRKGRQKDLEAAQDAPEEKRPQRIWRQPSFAAERPDGRAYGTAMHCAMQYLRFEACGSEAGVRQELHRLVQEGFLKPEQSELVSCDQIARFFESDVGWRLRCGAEIVREFKFSILDDGEKYGQGLEGEHVLLQGVVDCAIIEPDGITVLDFKTDHVTEAGLPQALERYRLQVQTYADALSRIFELPVKKSLLYFFRPGKFVEVI